MIKIQELRIGNFQSPTATEYLPIKGLAGSMLAKSCNDAGWSAFINKLDSKAADAGSQLAYVNSRGTSQTYLCGAPVPTILRPCWHQGEVGGAHDRQRCREG